MTQYDTCSGKGQADFDRFFFTLRCFCYFHVGTWIIITYLLLADPATLRYVFHWCIWPSELCTSCYFSIFCLYKNELPSAESRVFVAASCLLLLCLMCTNSLRSELVRFSFIFSQSRTRSDHTNMSIIIIWHSLVVSTVNTLGGSSHIRLTSTIYVSSSCSLALKIIRVNRSSIHGDK